MLTIRGDLGAIQYDERGLVPAVAQDAATGAVLMMAWMNAESLQKTINTGYAHYFSRSRQALWFKGETSGHTQKVIELVLDCDGDTLLMKVEQTGAACHTNEFSCFHTRLASSGDAPSAGFEAVREEFAVILDRQAHPKADSYTNYLLDKGVEKICKKIGEEASEVIIAAMKDNKEEMRYEIADLLFHVMVAMADRGLTWEDVLAEVKKRKK